MYARCSNIAQCNYVHQDLSTFIWRAYHSLTPLALLRLSLSFVRHLLKHPPFPTALGRHHCLRRPQSHQHPNGFGPPFPMALGHLPERLWACHQSYPRPLLQQQISPPAACPPSWTEVLVQPLMAPPVQRLIKLMVLQPSLLRMHPSLQVSSERGQWSLEERQGSRFLLPPSPTARLQPRPNMHARCLIVILIMSPRKAIAAKKPASKPIATKKAASKPAATKKKATKKPKSVSPPEHN